MNKLSLFFLPPLFQEEGIPSASQDLRVVSSGRRRINKEYFLGRVSRPSSSTRLAIALCFFAEGAS